MLTAECRRLTCSGAPTRRVEPLAGFRIAPPSTRSKIKTPGEAPGVGSVSPSPEESLKSVSLRFKRGYVAEFEETVSLLVPESSSDQFESALSELGSILGFEPSRPEKTYGTGPDVLWMISHKTGLIVEAKSRKNEANALTKAQHRQLLVSENWFKDTFKGLDGIRVSVHPNMTATKPSVPSGTKALTLAKLNELIGETRTLITDLCDSGYPEGDLAQHCEDPLKKSNLTPEHFVKHYLTDFEVKEID